MEEAKERLLSELDAEWLAGCQADAWIFALDYGAITEPEAFTGPPPIMALDGAIANWHERASSSRGQELKLIQALGAALGHHVATVTSGYWCYVQGTAGEELAVCASDGRRFFPFKRVSTLLRQKQNKGFLLGLFNAALNELTPPLEVIAA